MNGLEIMKIDAIDNKLLFLILILIFEKFQNILRLLQIAFSKRPYSWFKNNVLIKIYSQSNMNWAELNWIII